MIRSYLRGLVAEVYAADPLTLSEQLYLLFEGAITASQLHGEPWPAEYARQAAEKLVAASLGPQSSAMRQKAPSRGVNKRVADPSRRHTGMGR